MPNLIDIAQRLAERPMVALLHEERCLPERDLGSTCTRCAEACPVDAIAVGLERDTEASPAAAYGSVAKNGPGQIMLRSTKSSATVFKTSSTWTSTTGKMHVS